MLKESRVPGIGIGRGRGRSVDVGEKVGVAQDRPGDIVHKGGVGRGRGLGRSLGINRAEEKISVDCNRGLGGSEKSKCNGGTLGTNNDVSDHGTDLGKPRINGNSKERSGYQDPSDMMGSEEKFVPRPPKVDYIPNDDMDDYKLHVDCGSNFNKFDEVKVRVTGENIPASINSLEDVSIPSFLRSNIAKLGLKTLTPVQKHTIPIIMAGRDVMACAETGSGKTAAFLIPIIAAVHKLIVESGENKNQEGVSSSRTSPLCLVMVPSRELCRQVFTCVKELCKGEPRIRCSYGYGGVEMNSSLTNLHRCDILCATPGRLMQYINADVVLLDRLSFLVLDEADKLLSIDEFLASVHLVLNNARVINGRDLHVSLFSATFPREIQNLAQKILRGYLFVAVGIVGAANSDIAQSVVPATAATKLQLTLDYIANHNLGKTLIFVKRKRLADFYGIRLIEMGLSTTTIHGDRLQVDREKALNDFKSGRVEVLVATDVASRGLDIPHVDTVLNVDMPDNVDLYVHRIGRSGRCGNPGSAVTFFDVDEDFHQAPRLLQILRGSHQPCPDFLTKLGSGIKVDNSFKSSTKDLRIQDNLRSSSTSTTQVQTSFMNIQEDSDTEF